MTTSATPRQQVDSDTLVVNQHSQQTASPLSFTQQRLWLLNQLEPNNSCHNISVVISLAGSLNIVALEQSLNEILQRHEVLRSIYPVRNGYPVLIITPAMTQSLSMIDISELPEVEREAKAHQLATEEAQKPFDLTQDSLWRTTLLRVHEEKHLFLLTLHQIIADAESLHVLFRELQTLYEVFATENSLSLPQVPLQYKDWINWQQQWLQSEAGESQLIYWKNQLKGASPVLELPTDRPRPPVQTFRNARQVLEVSKPITEALKALSQQEECSLFMTLLAAFKVLLYRYTRQEDMIVGSLLTNPNQVEREQLIGLFVNSLVLRTNLSNNPSFKDLLVRVSQVTSGAFVNQELPFEKLVEELQLERNQSHHPLFQVIFVLQDDQIPTLELPGLSLCSLEVETGTTANLDLTLKLTESSEGLKGYFEYNADLFDAATIARMTGHFQTLLEGIVANPEQRLSGLPILTAAERHQLLVEWNDTEVDYPKDSCIHQLIEAQVERTPDAVAVVFEEESLTYRELNNRANQMAHFLRSLRTKPDVLVGISMERSLEKMVAVLGILKAGGAYVPLDPAFPKDRLTLIASDAELSVILTQQCLVEGLPEHNARVVCVDTEWKTIAQESTENLDSGVKSNNLAYVLYTSGSTGKPKGVQIPHGTVINFLTSMAKEPGLTSEDVWLSVTTLSFDIAVLEIFLPLCIGARLVRASRKVSADGKLLQDLIIKSGATVLQATPATWRLLLETGWQGNKKLKMLCGGEAMSPELANQLRSRGASLWNMYGPTETTIWSTVYQVGTSRLASNTKDAPESIGRPIANTQVYLLDAHLQPVPIGVPGELHIGGAGLARGYLNRPELTEEKFIPNPFSAKPGTRIYKTGDLARYLPDGNIEYISRIDHQVKIRGFRIELGEIEAVLEQHPAVQQAVVIAREDVPGDKRLVAYLVAKPEQTFTTSELRQFTKQKLPDYMVPSAFVQMDTLPLTPNEKVDRRALPAPDLTREESSETFIAPRDELERQLTKIWEQVLGVQPIGIQDNLFELGGHSLLVARLSDQIEKAFKKALPLTTIFQAPTVEQLANILRQEVSSTPWSSLAAIQPSGSKAPLFLCGGVSIYHPLVTHLDAEQPVYGLAGQAIPGKNPLEPFRFEELAAHYIKEMRSLQPEGPYYLGGLSFGGLVALEMAQQLLAQGQKVALLALFDTILPKAYKPLPIYQRVGFHLNRLLELGPSYAFRQFQERFQSLKTMIMRMYGKSYVQRQGDVPHAMEYFAMQELNSEAERAYVPQAYSGKITLFRAIDRVDAATAYVAPDLGWTDLARGGLEIYDVSGDHIEIFKEPHVRILGENLRTCLEQAQLAQLHQSGSK